LFLPVSGEILEFNPEIDENEGNNPAIINQSPYTDGWIVKIKMSNTEEANELMDAEEYEKFIS
jgi:glycine cleavage system H protein